MSTAVLGATLQDHDVCVIGAGPAGLACALTLHDRGLKVLVLDAGKRSPVKGESPIVAANIANDNAHFPTDDISASALGGSSHWWGGRLVPLDPVDFATWPVSYDEIAPWFRVAGEMMHCGGMVERPSPGAFANLTRFQAEGAESWVRHPNMASLWRSRLRAAKGITIVLEARVVGLNRDADKIASVDVLIDGQRHVIQARQFVLAGGGLGTLRLMLAAQRKDPTLFGGLNGPLGRGYMGHLTGSISQLAFKDPTDAKAFGFFKADGYVGRRRITSRSEAVVEDDICNIAFWLDGPNSADPTHGSPANSARFLAGRMLRSLLRRSRATDEAGIGPHLRNVARAPVSAIVGLAESVWIFSASRLNRKRFHPREFTSSGNGAWRLFYHAEQKPDPENRISLSDEVDAIGMPKLKIDFRFSDADAQSVVRAHELLDHDLRNAGAGSLRYNASHSHLNDMVWKTARDGYHQIGGAIMSANPAEGVVDHHCKVHGLENLHISAASVFPTGGQANPTLAVMALACRLADRIATVSRRPALARKSRGAEQQAVAST